MRTPTNNRSRAINGHDPAKRAEAAVRRWAPARPEASALAEATPPVHGSRWIPVNGPHLRTTRSGFARNTTGVVGISLSRRVEANGRKRSFYIANLGSTNRGFCIETLGQTEAWRRALAARAAHERKVAEANAAILAARALNAQEAAR